MKRAITIILALSALLSATADEKGKGYVFTDGKVIPSTKIENQFRSGTCWCYSAVTFLEDEILRQGGDKVELSEMWLARNIYFDKAVKYVRLHGHLNFAEGGATADVIEAYNKYGIVPQDVYKGLNYGTELPVFKEVMTVIKNYLDGVIAAKGSTLTTAWQRGLDGILDAYFGVRPEKFTYNGKEYTPKSFAESLPLKTSDYISLTSFTHHPFYSKFVLEVEDNWLWAESYNIPIDELVEVVDNSIDKGYTVVWATDVSERGFARKKCIGVIPDEKVESIEGTDAEKWGAMTKLEKAKLIYNLDSPRKEMEVDQQKRQEAFDNYSTTDDHGMVIVGTAKDQTGNEFYKVQNSWGEDYPYKGFFYFSKTFLKYKTTSIMVNRNAIPKDVRKKLGL